MKLLSAGLTFVNAATVLALLLGMAFAGLSPGIARVSLILALIPAVLAWRGTDAPPEDNTSTTKRIWFWLLAACFGFFALRSFCWLLFTDGNQLKVQSVNNLGDLSLHITYAKNFASGVPLWPDNPIHYLSKMRYPAGIDLFNGLLLLLGLDLEKGLIWVGLIGMAATFVALYRWGGAFTVAGLLFNGGLAGLKFLTTGKLIDYQAAGIAWKSLALSMLVPQRGLLYAVPAGVLLLYHWRAKYVVAGGDDPGRPQRGRLQLPFWVELSLYATMPLFHLHTFIALSIVAAFLFAFGNKQIRRHFAVVVGSAVVPATFLVWTVTDHFQAKSTLQLHLGWVQNVGEFKMPFYSFWIYNFGLFLPLVLLLLGFCVWYTKEEQKWERPDPALAFLAPATAIFLLAIVVKTAPWEWDNIKLILWAYLIVLPFLWSELVSRWSGAARAAVCFTLFASGFISLVGGLTGSSNGYTIADRAELEELGPVIKKLPAEARFAAFPTYNHPLLLEGRKVVLGYPGHLWTQGFDYTDANSRLEALMKGVPQWRDLARELKVRYIFWGREEKLHYGGSTKPWEHEATLVATGSWGAIYDLGPSI